MSQTGFEQAHIASALVFELSKVDTLHVREAVVGHLRHIDAGLAQRVADGLGLAKLPEAAAAAAPVQDMPASPALQIIGKMRDTLAGRCVGILIADGSDAKRVAATHQAVERAGASVKIVAPEVGGARMADGKVMAADGQLAGTPAVLFDAVAVLLSAEGAALLAHDAAAGDFVRNAFGHLKAIGVDAGGQQLMQALGVTPNAGVVDVGGTETLIAAAKTRQWAREAALRMLA